MPAKELENTKTACGRGLELSYAHRELQASRFTLRLSTRWSGNRPNQQPEQSEQLLVQQAGQRLTVESSAAIAQLFFESCCCVSTATGLTFTMTSSSFTGSVVAKQIDIEKRLVANARAKLFFFMTLFLISTLPFKLKKLSRFGWNEAA